MISGKGLFAFAAVLIPTAGWACEEAQFQHAQLAIAGDRLLQAERMIMGMRFTCGTDDRYLRLHARWALRTAQHEVAFSIFSNLVLRHPDDVEILSGLGRAAFNLGRLGEARQALMRATSIAGADWQAWNALAVLYDRRGSWEDSAAAYQQALSLSPVSAAIWNNRGYSMLLQRRPAEAVSDLERAVTLDSNNRTYRTNRDLAYAMSGRFDERREGEAMRDYARRLNNMGYAAWLAGNADAGRALVAQAIEASDVALARAERNLELIEGASD